MTSVCLTSVQATSRGACYDKSWEIIFVTERTDGRKDRLVSRGASTEDLISLITGKLCSETLSAGSFYGSNEQLSAKPSTKHTISKAWQDTKCKGRLQLQVQITFLVIKNEYCFQIF